MTGAMLMPMLIVVAKQPAAGQTKTRLCPPLTGATAAALYECFLRDTLDIMRATPDVIRCIGYLPEAADGYFRELAHDFTLMRQEGADLGERLDNLLATALAQGAAAAVVVRAILAARVIRAARVCIPNLAMLSRDLRRVRSNHLWMPVKHRR